MIDPPQNTNIRQHLAVTPHSPGAYRAQFKDIMNAKKLKSLRKAIRARGLHPRTVELSSGDKPFLVGAFLGRPGAMFTGQRILTKTCGRAYYQAAKRAIARGFNKHQAIA